MIKGADAEMAFGADELTTRLHAEFPDALRDGQVIGYFQPEIELSTGRLVAVELLARWEHPELGTLPPALFTALAEQFGLMPEFTHLMLRQALAQHRAWANAGWAVPVSVNIGPGCVADPAFPAAVADLLREEQVPGRMLALEVSEGTGTAAASSSFFAQLAEAGVRVSLDDFGTGFASLESLGGWPICELKLDRSIVAPIASSASFAAIVATTVDLAHQLGIKVVAEGIESEAVRSELRTLGCDIGQGFLLGRPMPAAAFTDWMGEQGRLVPRVSASGYWPAPSVTPAASRAARTVRRAVQSVGGGTLAAAAAMLAAYGLWQVFRWGGPQHQVLIGGLVFFPVEGCAALLSFRVSRRVDLGRRTCRAWRLIFIGVLCYMLGDLLRLLYAVVPRQGGIPAWTYTMYLGTYVFVFSGLMSFPARRRSGPERLRLMLDMGTVFSGGAVLIWFVGVSPILTEKTGFDRADLISFVFPSSDLLLLFGVLSALWRGAPRSSVTALRIFAVGMLSFIAAELSYDYIAAHSTYLGGDPVDTLWMLAVIIMCVSFACQLRTKPDGELAAPQRVGPARPSFVPYLAVAGCYLLLLIVGLKAVRFAPLGGILLGAVVLTIAVSTRQYIALRDLDRLAVRYRELAAIDGTTGLYNRRHFMEGAEVAFAHARRLSQPFTALMIDVDKFKEINDVYGHAVGDRVLAEFARSCREYVRPNDIVGRYGGDEFIIVVPAITSTRAIELADRLTRPTARALGRDGEYIPYTISVGIAECPPDGDLPTLLMHADLAMYEAKQAGGGGWRIFGETRESVRAEPGRSAAGLAPSAPVRKAAATQQAGSVS